MAFFRDFLRKNGQPIDTTYDEQDEAALVWFLVMARMNQSARGIQVPDNFTAPGDLTAEITKHMRFVGGFLCFFIAKPATYMRDMQAFRQYFIPGFATDRDRQVQLGQALEDAFFTAELEDLANAESLNLFFDTTELMIPATR